MKKPILLITLFAAVSLPAQANVYMGLEYGWNDLDSDYEPIINGRELKPKSKQGYGSLYIGYQFNDQWGIELGYSQFKLEDSHSIERVDAQYEYEQSWDAHIKAKSLTIMPIYRVAIGEKWKVNIGAGLSYSQYDFSAAYKDERESHVTDIDEVMDYQQGPYGEQSEVGVIVSIGTEYPITKNILIGARAKYQIDGYTNTTTFGVTTKYAF